jgi:hypothetical protein
MDPTASNQHVTTSPTLLPPSDTLTNFTLVNDAYSAPFTSRRVKQTNTSIPPFGADEMNEIVAVSAESQTACGTSAREQGDRWDSSKQQTCLPRSFLSANIKQPFSQSRFRRLTRAATAPTN